MTEQVISVGELNLLAREIIEANFPIVKVQGEISNLTYASSGHVYFTLKDQEAQVRCTMWRSKVNSVNFRMKEGQLVEVLAAATLYQGRGEFQLNIEKVSLSGQGSLYQKFLQIKDKLNTAGVFAPEQKRSLPTYPQRIVIITSRQAAALQDVLQILSRRAPHLVCTLYHVAVQGEGASEQIVSALKDTRLAQHGELVLLCRGGGAIEDLWCFNAEEVAYAIRDCPLPVISGIGHETDHTIADFAADVRAPTPSAAAEMICPERDVLLAGLQALDDKLKRGLTRYINEKQQKIDYLEKCLISPKQKIYQQKIILNASEQRFFQLKNTLLQRKKSNLEQIAAQLSALDPHAVLQRGYAIVQTSNGKTISSTGDLQAKQHVTLQFSLGSAVSEIVKIIN